MQCTATIEWPAWRRRRALPLSPSQGWSPAIGCGAVARLPSLGSLGFWPWAGYVYALPSVQLRCESVRTLTLPLNVSVVLEAAGVAVGDAKFEHLSELFLGAKL